MPEEQPDLPVPLDYANPKKVQVRRGIRWFLVLFLGIGGFIIIAALLPSDAGSHVSAAQRKCRSNLLDIGRNVRIYAGENGGIYPDSFQALASAEAVPPGTFVCPASNDSASAAPTTREQITDFAVPGHVSYIYLSKGLTDKTVLANQVIAYEALANHGGGIHVLLGDGHVEFIEKTRAMKVISDASAGKRPVMLPP